jgi:hypothetical protein
MSNNQTGGQSTPESSDVPPVPASIGQHTFAQPRNSSSSDASTPNVVPGSDGTVHSTITCFNCIANGHYANSCPSAVSLVQHTYTLAQSDMDSARTDIPKSWILLDSQSSISVFNNPQMLSNIRASPQEICVLTNGGKQTSNQVGDITNLGTIWYNPDSIANILSLSDVRKV